MRKQLLLLISIAAILTISLIWRTDSSEPSDAQPTLAATSVSGPSERGLEALPTATAWRLREPAEQPASRSSSGLEHLPSELLRPIAPGQPVTSGQLQLDLGAAGRFEAPVQTLSRHANGDVTVLARLPEADRARDPDRQHEQAILTWGERGLFGRIQSRHGLHLVHSDAGGSWLVKLDDPRLSVDHFDHDCADHAAGEHPHPGQPRSHQKESHPGHQTSRPTATGQALSAPLALETVPLIDVLFAYPPDMLVRYPGGLIETRLNHLVSIANQTLVDSQVSAAVRLVGHEAFNYNLSQNNSETLGNLRRALSGEAVPGLSGLAARRDALAADIVAFTWPHDIETRGSCGVAYFPVFENGRYDPDFGVHIDNDGFSNWSVCSDAVFTHELGHNLNAQHQRSQSGNDDPDRGNYAWIRENQLHTIMGSFGTGDRNRYLRLDLFSNPQISCGGASCGSDIPGQLANNAAEIQRLAPFVAAYRQPGNQSVERPAPSSRDQDGDGLLDRDDPYPFDPLDGQPDPNPAPELVFSPRQLAAPLIDDSELLVVSSGNDRVLAYQPDGRLRSIALLPERVNAGPILTEYSDLISDQQGRLYLLASGDVRRYDRLSGRLIDVFLGSGRPQPADLLSAFPRAMATLPNNQFVVLGDFAIERFAADSGQRLSVITGSEGTRDPQNWNQRLDLALRAAAHRSLRLYVAEARDNRILTFSAATGQRLPDVAPAGNGQISDPWDLAFDSDGLLYLANGAAGNVLRFDPGSNLFIDEFVAAGSGGLEFARALAFGPDGNLYVADHQRSQILRFDGNSGEFLELVVAPNAGGLSEPTALAFSGQLRDSVPGASGHFFVSTRAGEGWLLERLGPDSAAMSWFTYPPSGSEAAQAWLVGVGRIDGPDWYFDDVLLPRGQGFAAEFDPNSIELEPWGDIQFSFYDCNSGQASWNGPPGWGSGQRRFERLIEIPGLPCGSQPRPPSAERPGVSGQWFDPARSGQGWFLQETGPGQIFAAWYAHDQQGQQLWLVGSGELVNGEARFEQMLKPRGTFFGEAFDPAAVALENWGELTLRFSDCNNAIAEYSALDPAIGSGLLYPERLTRLDALDCQLP